MNTKPSKNQTPLPDLASNLLQRAHELHAKVEQVHSKARQLQAEADDVHHRAKAARKAAHTTKTKKNKSKS